MRRHLRRPLLIAGLSLAIVTLLLAGVGGTAQSQQVPAAGGVYIEGVVGHPTYLNPLLSPFNNADQDIVALVFDGLTKVAPDGSVAPDLADRWTISPDGKTYTFHLRNAVWQDGQPVTADDVVFTIGQIQAPGFPGNPEVAQLWQPIKVSKIDQQTVQFQLTAPYAPFLEYTTQRILPVHLLNGVTGRQMLSNPFNAHPIGTGPFMVKSATVQEITLEPNPHYYGKQPYLAGITFRYYDSSQSALDALRRGDIQGLGGIPSDSALSLANDSRLTILQKPEFANLNVLVLNTQSSIFSDDLVRRALDLALNRTQIIQAAMGGEGVPAAGPIMPDSWAFVPQANAYIYAPDQAAKLLDQAGWTLPTPGAVREKDGKPFRFVLLAANQSDRLRAAQEISRELR
ncbi:MAG TPA: peptide ABC transporter substrate-binding protein, partial [Chloroflexota bacterium]|nr:peptide ABC transporter substrate-binding protein [Chloroflexota bacterium]